MQRKVGKKAIKKFSNYSKKFQITLDFLFKMHYNVYIKYNAVSILYKAFLTVKGV